MTWMRACSAVTVELTRLVAKTPYVIAPAPGSSIQEIIAVPYWVEATAVELVHELARRGSPVVAPRRRVRSSRRAVVPESFKNEASQTIKYGVAAEAVIVTEVRRISAVVVIEIAPVAACT
jgi:hypothetical protein